MKKRGISLMVLVITVIVMIILATTIIISVTDNDSIEKATEVIKNTDVSKVQSLADIGLNDILKKNSGNLVGVDVEEELQEYLASKKVNVDDYNIVYNTLDKTVAVSQATYIPIYTEEDLAKIANGNNEILSDKKEYEMKSTANYKIMNDIIITKDFTPIEFVDGKIIGNNKKITINSNIIPAVMMGSEEVKGIALILVVGENAVINDLGIGGDIEVSSTAVELSAVSTIAALNIGKIDGCYNEANITIISTSPEGGTLTGGIVAYNVNTIKNSYNRGNIMAVNEICGGIASSSNNTIREAEVNGDEISENRINNYIHKTINTNITNSYNVGNIEARMAGGIVSSIGHTSINGCFNKGKILGKYTVGGIAEGGKYSKIINCYNAGNISNNSIENFECVAGILGSGGSDVSIFNSYNVGKISKIDGSIGKIKAVVTDEETDRTNVEYCYYLDDGTVNDDNATGLTETNMKSTNFFNILDNNSKGTWKAVTNSYPKLAWE